MSGDEDALGRRIRALGDEELAKMVFVEHDRYREEALEIARAEAQRRSLSTHAHSDAAARNATGEGAAPRPVRIDPRGLVPIWPGFLLAVFCFVIEIVASASSEDVVETARIFLIGTALIAYVYWLACVHALHVVLRNSTRGRYEVSPLRAVGFHFIPCFNVIWIFEWPYRLAKFLQTEAGVRFLPRLLPGLGFLAAVLLRGFDTAIAVAVQFATTAWLQHAVRWAARQSATLSEVPEDWSSNSVP